MMHDTLPSFPRAVMAAALRGDDALARAAADFAAPRRRLVGALRDAHAEAALRVAALRAATEADTPSTPHAALARLLAEAEEQLRRLEMAFAHLPGRPGDGRMGGARPSAQDAPPGRARRGATFGPAVLAAEELRGAAEARALRDLAHLAGQHLAARLLDMTAEERAATARDIERLAGPTGRFDG
jgi:ferritin-like metal-binding protein YciE